MIGAAHAGWRGAVAGRARGDDRAPWSALGARPARIAAAIGPCIGQAILRGRRRPARRRAGRRAGRRRLLPRRDGARRAGNSTSPATARRRLARPAFADRACRRRYGRRRGPLLQPSPPHAGGRRPDRAPNLRDRAAGDAAASPVAPRAVACCFCLCICWLASVRRSCRYRSCFGCGDFPRPFHGAGAACGCPAAGAPARGPRAHRALLTDAASRSLRGRRGRGSAGSEVPAVAERVQPGDWRLVMTAEQRGGAVVPSYTVQNPQGEPQGQAEGKPVPAAAWAAAEPATLKTRGRRRRPAVADLLTRIEAAHPAERPEQPVQPAGPGPGRARSAARRATAIRR